MIPVAVSLGTKEGIIAAIIMVIMNVYQDKTESKPLEVINADADTSEIIFTKGTYFCPFYCKISHPHRAHSAKHDCESDKCTHFIAEPYEENLAIQIKNVLE